MMFLMLLSQFLKKVLTNLVAKVTILISRHTYDEAMLKYGSDKPDLRNPIEICPASDVFVGSGFSIFTKAIDSGSVIRAIPAPKCGDKPRSFFDKTIEFAQSNGAKGLAYINFDENGAGKGPIAKFLSDEKLQQLKHDAGVGAGDAVFFSCGKEKKRGAGLVRAKLGEDLELIDHLFTNLLDC